MSASPSYVVSAMIRAAGNAATISFRTVDGVLRVRQTHFSEASPASALGAPNTVHETAVAPPVGAPVPQLETDA